MAVWFITVWIQGGTYNGTEEPGPRRVLYSLRGNGTAEEINN